MRHLKDSKKLGRTSSHKRCMMANMLKSLIDKERITTTIPKAKELRRYADKMITLAKKNTLSTRRRAVADLMVTFNSLTTKEVRLAKNGNTNAFNTDRRVIEKLFGVLGPRFSDRNGGYTRIVKKEHRVGDNAQLCVIEYLPE
jgi:large subunit ribosomal protein L17